MAIAATSTLCSIFTFLLAGSPIYYSTTPRGECSNCCEIREREDVKFLLYTRQNSELGQLLYPGDQRRLAKSNFNFNYPLAVYMHGFSESATGRNQSGQRIKDAFMRSGNYNVILVDWSAITAAPWYTNAVENMPMAARYTARFLRYLINSGFSSKQIHLIGFSLGAEMAGFVGKQMQQWGIMLPRITGLDPALPLFELGSPNRRLGPKDARFVDIIHTDGGILGNPDAMGHADFYPNGGRALQPGCARQEIANNRWLGILIGCSHQRAWEYFIESISRPLAFPMSRCEPSRLFGECKHDNGRAFMGMAADKRLRGRFYLETNDAPPYGRRTSSRQFSLFSAALSAVLPIRRTTIPPFIPIFGNTNGALTAAAAAATDAGTEQDVLATAADNEAAVAVAAAGNSMQHKTSQDIMKSFATVSEYQSNNINSDSSIVGDSVTATAAA